MTGKEIRMRRLFMHSKRLFIVPMDHGLTMGPIAGLKDIQQAVKAVSDGGADAFVVHKGLVNQVKDLIKPGGSELIIHLSASTALSPDGNRKELVGSVEHAIRLGATAVSVHVNLAAVYEAEMLKDLGKIAEDCDLWGMPLLVMIYVRDGTGTSDYDPVKIKHAARVAEEVGADIIKVNYTGSPDTFAEVTSGVTIPVVIAGGPRMDSTPDLLTMIADAVEAGAKGISIGRNVFQNEKPAELAGIIRRILDSDKPKDYLKQVLVTIPT